MAVELEKADPKEATNEQHALENKVGALLAARLGGRVQDFKLFRRDDALVIQGRAKSYYAKQIAQQLVMEVVRQACPRARHSEPWGLINEIEI